MRGSIDDWTMVVTLSVFFAIFAVFVGVLIILLLSPVHTFMQRGWRSLIIGCNLIMARSTYQVLSGDNLAQPYELILWAIAGVFIGHFAIAFHYTWVAPLLGALGRARFVLPLAILAFVIIGVSLVMTFYG